MTPPAVGSTTQKRLPDSPSSQGVNPQGPSATKAQGNPSNYQGTNQDYNKINGQTFSAARGLLSWFVDAAPVDQAQVAKWEAEVKKPNPDPQIKQKLAKHYGYEGLRLIKKPETAQDGAYYLQQALNLGNEDKAVKKAFFTYVFQEGKRLYRNPKTREQGLNYFVNLYKMGDTNPQLSAVLAKIYFEKGKDLTRNPKTRESGKEHLLLAFNIYAKDETRQKQGFSSEDLDFLKSVVRAMAAAGDPAQALSMGQTIRDYHVLQVVTLQKQYEDSGYDSTDKKLKADRNKAKDIKAAWDVEMADWALANHDMVMAHALLIDSPNNDADHNAIYNNYVHIHPLKQKKLFELSKDPQKWLNEAEYWLKQKDFLRAKEHLKFAKAFSKYSVLYWKEPSYAAIKDYPRATWGIRFIKYSKTMNKRWRADIQEGRALASKKDLDAPESKEFLKDIKDVEAILQDAEGSLETEFNGFKKNLENKRNSGTLTKHELFLLDKALPQGKKILDKLDSLAIKELDVSKIKTQVRADLMAGFVTGDDALLDRATENFNKLITLENLEAQKGLVKTKFEEEHFRDVPKRLRFITNVELSEADKQYNKDLKKNGHYFKRDNRDRAVQNYHPTDDEPQLHLATTEKHWYKVFKGLTSVVKKGDPDELAKDSNREYFDLWGFTKIYQKTPEELAADKKLYSHWINVFGDLRDDSSFEDYADPYALNYDGVSADLNKKINKLNKLYGGPEVQEIFTRLGEDQQRKMERNPDLLDRQALTENLIFLKGSQDILTAFDQFHKVGANHIPEKKLQEFQKLVLDRLDLHEKFLEREVHRAFDKRVKTFNKTFLRFGIKLTGIKYEDIEGKIAEIKRYASKMGVSEEKINKIIGKEFFDAKKALDDFKSLHAKYKTTLTGLDLKDTKGSLGSLEAAFKDLLACEEIQAVTRISQQLDDVSEGLPKDNQFTVLQYQARLIAVLEIPDPQKKFEILAEISKETDDLALIAHANTRVRQFEGIEAGRNRTQWWGRALGLGIDLVAYVATGDDPDLRDMDLSFDVRLTASKYRDARNDFIAAKKEVKKDEAVFKKAKHKYEKLLKECNDLEIATLNNKDQIAQARAAGNHQLGAQLYAENMAIQALYKKKANELANAERKYKFATNSLKISEKGKEAIRLKVLGYDKAQFWKIIDDQQEYYGFDKWYMKTANLIWEGVKIGIPALLSGGISLIPRGMFAARGWYAATEAGAWSWRAFTANRVVQLTNATVFYLGYHTMDNWSATGRLDGLGTALKKTGSHVWNHPGKAFEGIMLDFAMFETLGVFLQGWEGTFKLGMDRIIAKRIKLPAGTKFTEEFFAKNPAYRVAYDQAVADLFKANRLGSYQIIPRPQSLASAVKHVGAFGVEMVGFQVHEFNTLMYMMAKEGKFDPGMAARDAFGSGKKWIESMKFLLALKASNHAMHPLNAPIQGAAMWLIRGKDAKTLTNLEGEYAELMAEVMLANTKGVKDLSPYFDRMNEIMKKEKAIYEKNPLMQEIHQDYYYQLVRMTDVAENMRTSYQTHNNLFGENNPFGVKIEDTGTFSFGAKHAVKFVEKLAEDPSVSQVNVSENGRVIWIRIKGLPNPQTGELTGERIIHFRSTEPVPRGLVKKIEKMEKKIKKINHHAKERPTKNQLPRAKAPVKNISFDAMDIEVDRPTRGVEDATR